jgi:dihydroneopterin aldolase/D-erythro-7,8-dihydroneopterin triphosphate epimerase
MDYDKADRIHIRDLLLRPVIGVYPEERDIRQDILLNITLYSDQKPAAETDDFNLTVDYHAVHDSIVELVESSSFRLIESLAAAVADLILNVEGVRACRVVVDKPAVLRFSKSIAVEIFREREA